MAMGVATRSAPRRAFGSIVKGFAGHVSQLLAVWSQAGSRSLIRVPWRPDADPWRTCVSGAAVAVRDLNFEYSREAWTARRCVVTMVRTCPVLPTLARCGLNPRVRVSEDLKFSCASDYGGSSVGIFWSFLFRDIEGRGINFRGVRFVMGELGSVAVCVVVRLLFWRVGITHFRRLVELRCESLLKA